MQHDVHDNHPHQHNDQCGHTAIHHQDHIDYLHEGHLHSAHSGHYDEHVIEVSSTNPDQCAPTSCTCAGHTNCDHPVVPHGNHQDHLYEGRLHHLHGDHCDDHGPVNLA